MDIRKGKQPHHPFQYMAQTLKMGFLGVLALSCFYAFNHLELSRYFPIKTVRVYGVNRVNPNDIQALLIPLVNRSFFNVNVEYIRDRLLQMPWVSDTFVKRYWPDRVEITVVEKNPIARWNDKALLSQGGELFTPTQNTYPGRLPIFMGPEGKQILMMQYYEEINRLLTPIHAKVSYLEMTPYATWKLTLDNGITLQIGHKDILTRFSHFVKVYPKIIGDRVGDVEYVDLRYSNGMAVRWKTSIKT
jgi:cell division protein FtsQ